ncbi:MAG: hypothetical protein KGL59_06485 [Acidobacteriota bacterium]|nr:hypothetical protein [Acidobacteriota bacterium]
MRTGLAAVFVLLFALPHTTPQVDPATLAARDSHQGILIACDPYQDTERAKKAIGKENPLKAGILPVEVYVQNSTRLPVAISLDSIRLEIAPPQAEREQIEPLSAGDVATLILHPQPKNPSQRRLPIPFPTMGHNGKWQKLHDQLQSLAFPDAVVAPGATVRGFFYFNLSGDFSVVRYARLYVPDLKFLGNTQAIMFFDVHFSPASTN